MLLWLVNFTISLNGILERPVRIQSDTEWHLSVLLQSSWTEALSQSSMRHIAKPKERWITMGLDHTGVLLVVCHTFRDETELSARLRLISARKATKVEAAEYEKRKIQ